MFPFQSPWNNSANNVPNDWALNKVSNFRGKRQNLLCTKTSQKSVEREKLRSTLNLLCRKWKSVEKVICPLLLQFICLSLEMLVDFFLPDKTCQNPNPLSRALQLHGCHFVCHLARHIALGFRLFRFVVFLRTEMKISRKNERSGSVKQCTNDEKVF